MTLTGHQANRVACTISVVTKFQVSRTHLCVSVTCLTCCHCLCLYTHRVSDEVNFIGVLKKTGLNLQRGRHGYAASQEAGMPLGSTSIPLSLLQLACNGYDYTLTEIISINNNTQAICNSQKQQLRVSFALGSSLV